MGGRHGEAIVIKLLAESVEFTIGKRGVEGPVAFDLAVTSGLEFRIDAAEGLEIAGAVKLKAKFGHGGSLLLVWSWIGRPVP